MRLESALLLASLLASFPAAADSPCAKTAPGSKTVSAACIKERVATLRDVRKVFLQIAGEPLPRNLTPQDAKVAERWIAWLKSWAPKLEALAETGERSTGGSRGGDRLLDGTKQMQETQMSFNVQYLQLQNTMQNENRQFTMVSNIMKTKHDTVKNSISNIR
jgi:hypothetical protein